MGRNVNTITICGSLGADAEVKQWDDGCTIEWRMAVNDSVKRNGNWEDEADWFQCRMNRKTAGVADYLRKGTKITVSGRMKTKKYEKDGQTRVFHFIKVLEMDLPRKDGNQGPQTQSVFGGADDDIPF